MIVYIIASAFIVYFVIRIAVEKRTENIKIAFAGAYDGNETVKSFPKERNKTIYTEGEDVVDLSEYDKFVISGRSLEKVGLNDGVFVYTQPLGDNNLYSICNRFVIFKYDNKRLLEEHPEITNPVDGYKARKVSSIFDNNLSENDFKRKIREILSHDSEIQDKEECTSRLWTKYSFAARYYNGEDRLIVSITYKNGEDKDYSFHSKKYLHGVVKYKSVAN